MIKRFIMMLLMTSVLFLSACSEDDELSYFPSKEEAIEDLIQSDEIKGNIDLITTTNDEELLVIKLKKNMYSAGELFKNKDGYSAHRISANVVMEMGGSWELETNSNHKYTIYFEKEQENQNYFQLSNKDYYISLAEGHKISTPDPSFTNAINEIRAVTE
ncbi:MULTISPECIES: hypothetical protein [Sporosarcina]|uniref:hypothetical protein n=1 Tax=Sporosarcina TaxID=1569 RepID=UPI00129BAC24|nr:MULTISPECIES: hypothetical protein [Sporosarcina]GKV64494.1 hypothetical protein NCCP2331_06470 [Sporosarcina sp. NCCP-2331]GLB57526.1 hypothetical protein NCCP2378_33150 [Sporosarcina sp. NCCP-2378]